jgi:hypothetical protein
MTKPALALEGADTPTEFVACTVQVYVAPALIPVITVLHAPPLQAEDAGIALIVTTSEGNAEFVHWTS